MIQIGNILVSLDVIEQYFCCDFDKCKGECCIEGDAGAPLTQKEKAFLENDWENATPFLSERNINIIRTKGVSYIDQEGDLVTTIIDGRDCAFSCFYKGKCLCAIEKAFEMGLSQMRKPSSCALYPIRITHYPNFTAVNLHKWDICKEAFKNGRNKKIRVYQFLKNALIEEFGQEWYNELDLTAQIYLEEKIKHQG